MARTKTDSFILELKLKTSPADDAYLEKCFSAGCSICNTLVRHCRRQIASLRQEGGRDTLRVPGCPASAT